MKNKDILLIKENIQKRIVGNDRVLELLFTAILSGGHVLLEDTPGSGKTVLAKALAQSLNLAFRRIQFTPDLLPTDVTGMNVFNQEEGKFVFHPGPVFCNILLGDEINRATPRTQSGLLECMEEKQVTVDGQTRKLNAPFLVIATQNPVETSGTFPLPEAQMDRFFMQLSMDPMPAAGKRAILQRAALPNAEENLTPVCTQEALLHMQEETRKVYIHPDLTDYIVALIEETQNITGNQCPVSHRGMIAIQKAAQAHAYLSDRDFATPEDVKTVAVAVLSHRLILEYGTGGTQKKEHYIRELLEKIPVPTENWRKG